MFRPAQSRNRKNRNIFLGIANKRQLTAIGRPGWAAVARITRKLQRLLPSYDRGEDSGVMRAITLTEGN